MRKAPRELLRAAIEEYRWFYFKIWLSNLDFKLKKRMMGGESYFLEGPVNQTGNPKLSTSNHQTQR